MPTTQRSMASYWNGSAWVDIVIPSTTSSALILCDLDDIIAVPTVASLRISNRSNDPTDSNASNSKGPYTDVFTDFVPIRVKDGDSGAILFYGITYSTKEIYDMSYGMVIELQCKDYLIELRDNSTDGAYGYKIDASANVDAYVLNTTSRDDDKKVWNTLVSSRGGIIKSLINQFSNNVGIAADRFSESVNKFGESGTYKLGGRNQKSILAHILALSSSEPYTVSGEEVFGYDFYIDPGFTSTAASSKPTANFNYFKRGQRPNVDSNPEIYGLRIEHPSAANFAPTGKLLPMLDFDFERPRGEIFTDAVVKYTATSETEDGGVAVEERIVPFEIIEIKAASNSLSTTVPRWKGLPIAAGHIGFNEDDGVLFPEWLQVQISGTWTTVARMQYINKTSSISNSAPAYVLISDVNPALSDTDAYFAENVVWRGKTTNALTFTLKSRPRTKYGVRRTLKLSQSSGSGMSAIREQIAAALMRTSTQIIRGSFKTYDKPQYYFDNQVTVSGTSTQTITLGGSVNPLQQGFRVGMTVAELNAQDGDVTSTYGYASAVTETTVTVTWSTGYAANSDYLRFFVPVRAGDLVYLKNNLVNIAGNYLVTKVKYSEQPGVSNTHYDVVGRETNKDGGYNRKAFAVATAEVVNTKVNIPQAKPNAGRISESITNLKFTSSLTNEIAWGTGDYNTSSDTYPSNGTLTVGINQYAITAGTTASTMVSDANGNTGQSGLTLTADTDYYIYYSGSGSALATVKKANFRAVADEDTILIGHCRADTDEAELTIFIQKFSIPDKGSATKKLTKHSLTSALLKEGAQPWSTNVEFEGTDYNIVRWGLSTSIGSDGTVSFGDDTTETVTKHTGYTFSAGTSWVYKTVGLSKVALPVVTQNYNEVTRSDTDRILMATVVVVSDVGQESPTISPVYGHTPTMSVGAFAARSILATDIKTGAITTGELNFAYASEINGNAGLRSESLATIRSVVDDPTGTIAGLQVTAATLHMGTGHFGQSNTPFFVRGVNGTDGNSHAGTAGDFSLGDQFVWDQSATELTVGGVIKLGDTDDSGGTDGKFFMYDTNGALGLRLRTYAAWNLLDSSARGIFLSMSGSDGSSVTVNSHVWAKSNNYFSPYTHSYLGNPTSGTNGYGWAALALGGTSNSKGTVVLIAPDADYTQKLITLPNGADFDFNGGSNTNVLSTDGSGTLSWVAAGGGSGVSLSGSTNNTIATVVDANSLIGEANLTFDGSKLEINGRINLTSPLSAGSIPTGEYGVFRYTLDGGGGSADTLAFASNQTSNVPLNSTDRSAFWIMQSEAGHLIFEPSVGFSGNNNTAYIGYHNWILAVRSYYMEAGNGSASYPSITFMGNDDNGFWYNPAQGTDTVSLSLSGNEEYVFSASWFKPADDNSNSLGTGLGRWTAVHATNGTIQTSDIRQKTQIRPTTLGLDFVNLLNPISYKWKDKPDTPTHQGLIAQEVLEVLKKSGLQTRDEFGAVDGDEDTSYGLNYSEFVPILIKAIKELSEKIKKLEEDK